MDKRFEFDRSNFILDPKMPVDYLQSLCGIPVHPSKWVPQLFWKELVGVWVVSEDVWEMMKNCKDEIDLATLWRLCNDKN